MFRFGKLAVSIVAATTFCGSVNAAPDTALDPGRQSGYEVVVVEADGCVYCRVFRSDVLPAYQATPRAASVPLRFADIDALEAGSLKLTGPIESVPTVLVLRDSREVGRLTGYLGRANFLHSLAQLLAGTE